MGNEKIDKIIEMDFIEVLRQEFPLLFEEGNLNEDKLNSLLTKNIIGNKDQRFYFNWANKDNIYGIIQSPGLGSLKPIQEKAINFSETNNIIIIGENLEVLKLLQKSYFSKIKLIYIDPPYNTGKDFIYKDNFSEPLKDYFEKTGQLGAKGEKLVSNKETSGRFHSDWLNFIYPRLYLARNLLSDDGVIFVSIDDNEYHHLRLIMNEIYGEENFIANFIRRQNLAGKQDAKFISFEHDYILCYAKKVNQLNINRKKSDLSNYNLIDHHLKDRGKFYLRRMDDRGIHYSESLDYPIKIEKETEYLFYDKKRKLCITRLAEKDIIIWPGGDEKDKTYTWRWSKGKVEWGKDNNFIVIRETRDGDLSVTFKEYQFVDNKLQKYTRTIPFGTFIMDYPNNLAHKGFKELFNNEQIFDYPKPIELIKHLLKIGSDKDSIILDFFAGSGTTGHAVWDLNKDDDGKRNFILINIDEEVLNKNIRKQFPKITDICIERLKRASKKFTEEEKSKILQLNQDLGFKVFKLEESNFNLVEEIDIDNISDEKIKMKYLETLSKWIETPFAKSNWKSIDIIYEILIKQGFNINSKINELKIRNNNFFHIIDEKTGFDFYITLNESISKESIEEISSDNYRNKLFIFLDKALTDNDKINLKAFIRLKVI